MDMTTLAMAERNRQLKPFNLMEHPAVDIVFDSCYRDVATRTNAENMVLDSGHTWEKLQLRSDNPTLRYEPNGVLQFSGGGSQDESTLSGWLVEGFSHTAPYIEFRLEQSVTFNWRRIYYLKFIDENNWIGIRREHAGTSILLMVSGITTVVASLEGWMNRIYPYNVTKLRAEIRNAHATFSTANRVIVVYESDQEVLSYGITEADWESLKAPGKVGFGARAATYLYGFKAGVSIL